MDHLFFATDSLRELYIKLINLPLLLEVVAYESASPVRHLTQTIREAFVHLIAPSVRLLAVRHLIGHVPHVVRYESLHEVLLVGGDQAFLDCGHSVRKA